MLELTDNNTNQQVRRNIIRKLDTRLLPMLWLIFFLCAIDRTNVGHVRLYNLERDLNMSSELFGWGLTSFFIGYVGLEIPSNMLLQRLGPNVWFSRIMVSWGLVTFVSAFASNSTGFIILRFLLGVAEAGLFPGVLYVISLWYAKEEQATRIAIFTSASISGIMISGPLTTGIVQIGNWLGLASWQWVFILEGIPTIIIGILLYWIIPNYPRKCTWLSAAEKEILQKEWDERYGLHPVLSFNFLLKSFKSCFNIYTIVYAIIQFTYLTPKYTQVYLLPTIVRDLGFSSQSASLLTCPPSLFGLIISFIVAWTSDKYLERGFHIAAACFISFLGHLFLVFLPPSQTILRYLSVFLLTGGSACAQSSFFAWASNNTHGGTNLAITMAFLAATGNIGGMISGQFFRKSEAPNYYISHSICATGYLLSVIITISLRYFLSYKNRNHSCSYTL